MTTLHEHFIVLPLVQLPREWCHELLPPSRTAPRITQRQRHTCLGRDLGKYPLFMKTEYCISDWFSAASEVFNIGCHQVYNNGSWVHRKNSLLLHISPPYHGCTWKKCAFLPLLLNEILESYRVSWWLQGKSSFPPFYFSCVCRLAMMIAKRIKMLSGCCIYCLK